MSDNLKAMKLLLSLGSNLQYPKAEENLIAVREEMACFWSSEVYSGIYRTLAVGEGKGYYYNCVASVSTSHSLIDIRKLLKNIELLYGRTDDCRSLGRVPIDIDIVCSDTEVFRIQDLSRSYVQIGLNELIKRGERCWEGYLAK